MTPYLNIYSVIPSPATVTVLMGRGMVLEICTGGIPVVNPTFLAYHISESISQVHILLWTPHFDVIGGEVTIHD